MRCGQCHWQWTSYATKTKKRKWFKNLKSRITDIFPSTVFWGNAEISCFYCSLEHSEPTTFLWMRCSIALWKALARIFFYSLLGTQTTAALIGDLTTFRKSLFVKLIQRIFEKIPKDDKIFSKFFRQSRLKLPGRGATTLQKDEEPIFFSLMFSLGPVINPTSGKDFFIWSRKHLILRQTSHWNFYYVNHSFFCQQLQHH